MPGLQKSAFGKIKRIFARIAGSKSSKPQADFYKGKNYIDGYIAHTEWRVAQDPKAAIGGMWNEIGSLQFDFLRGQGLEPHHRMLDLGCGTLRGGRHFILYLDKANYTGIDIAPACLEAARKLLKDERLEDKNPTLILNASKSLNFAELNENKFDYILAQSVLTHLPDDMVRECFANVGKVMNEGSRFYFTYWLSETYGRFGDKNFSYPWRYFEELAADNGFEAFELSDSYPHPRDQKMGCVARK